MNKLLIAAIFVITIGGCTPINRVVDKGAGKVSDLIIKYCDSIDEQSRLKFRAEINEKLGIRANIRVECN